MANTLTPIQAIKKPAWKDDRWDVPTNENWDAMDGLLPPKGGTTGQVLAKKSDTDNDLEFIDGGGGGGGGLAWETTSLDTVSAENGKIPLLQEVMLACLLILPSVIQSVSVTGKELALSILL